ncbi:MAG: regulator, partial [Armatimonadota bacterium]
MRRSGLTYLLPAVLFSMALAVVALVRAGPGTPRFPLYERWQTYDVHDGLPSEKCFAVRMQGPRVWVGTDNGLACLEGGRWRVYTTEDGLPHRACLWIDVSEQTGDVWIATMGGGLCRYSAGRFDTFNQFNSGLPNDVVFAVACQEEYVWAATPAGVGRYNTYTDQWSIWDINNAPMHEPWCYHVSWSP